MTNFKDLGIAAPPSSAMVGEKIKISKVLNREITVHAFSTKPSKFMDKGSGTCLNLQIAVDGDKRVIFTSSTVLLDQVKRVPEDKFPFKTKIVQKDEAYEFT
jgi:hypothetical protein